MTPENRVVVPVTTGRLVLLAARDCKTHQELSNPELQSIANAQGWEVIKESSHNKENFNGTLSVDLLPEFRMVGMDLVALNLTPVPSLGVIWVPLDLARGSFGKLLRSSLERSMASSSTVATHILL